MNLKKNYGSNPGMEVRPTLIDKAKGIRNFNLYMKKGATIMDKSLISKNPKSLSINEKLSYNPKVLNESLLKYKPIETRNDSKINPSETSFTNNNIDIKISVNYLKQNNFKESNKLKEDNNNSSLSNILIKDMQNKENMLKNLKTAITEDKNIRKKFYSNEKDLNNITILPNNEMKQIHKRNPTSNQEIIQNNLNTPNSKVARIRRLIYSGVDNVYSNSFDHLVRVNIESIQEISCLCFLHLPSRSIICNWWGRINNRKLVVVDHRSHSKSSCVIFIGKNRNISFWVL